MSDEQYALQQELVERYERLRSQKVDPRVDNALSITTDGRKLATDARMLSATAPDFPESKVNRLVENVASVWERTAPTRGTQMIFADMGVNPTAWGYSPYDEIIAKLVAHGIPREQIAAIGDAESDAKKQALFEKVRQRFSPRADRQHPENGHRHQRPETPRRPASPRRSLEASGSRAARRAASCARGTRMRKWRSTAMSRKDHSTLICGRR